MLLSGFRHGQRDPGRIPEEQEAVPGEGKQLTNSSPCRCSFWFERFSVNKAFHSQEEVGVETDEDCKVVVPTT